MLKDKTVLVMGGLIQDLYFNVDRFPPRGMDSLITKKNMTPGGCALNVAVALSNLGLDPYIVAAIGNSAADRALADYLRQRSLSDACIRVEEHGDTGFCVILVEEDGERTFLTYKGVEGTFRESMIPEHLLRQTSYVYLTGYYLQEKAFHEPILAALRKLKDHGARILFDPGVLVSEIGGDTLSRVLDLSFCITPNEKEWELIDAALRPNCGLIERLFAGGVELILKKHGKYGVQVIAPDREFRAYPYDVATVDTTGAGDAFAGGLLYGLAAGETLERSVSIASACGSLTTTVWGPHCGFGIADIERTVRETPALIADTRG